VVIGGNMGAGWVHGNWGWRGKEPFDMRAKQTAKKR
jgi:hypothetical protein